MDIQGTFLGSNGVIVEAIYTRHPNLEWHIVCWRIRISSEAAINQGYTGDWHRVHGNQKNPIGVFPIRWYGRRSLPAGVVFTVVGK